MKVAVLTVSDRCARGERVDQSGTDLKRWLADRGAETLFYDIVADEVEQIVERIREWADCAELELILTTGGTGVSPRDVTPQATLPLLDMVIPGLAELMRSESLKITSMAALSRGVAGVCNRTLVVNLPGSPAGAVENIAAIWGVIPHAIAKIGGDMGDCAAAGRP